MLTAPTTTYLNCNCYVYLSLWFEQLLLTFANYWIVADYFVAFPLPAAVGPVTVAAADFAVDGDFYDRVS